MSTSAPKRQSGSVLLIGLILVFVLLIGSAFLVKLGVINLPELSSKKTNTPVPVVDSNVLPTPTSSTDSSQIPDSDEYSNPFESDTSYVNPFSEDSENPFNNLE